MILDARSSYYYDNMFIICLFPDILSDFKTCFGLSSRKIAGTFAVTLRFLMSRQHVFRIWFHTCNLLYVTSPQTQVTDVSLVLKDSDMDSENLSSLIRLSVSDGQKTDSRISYRYIIKCDYSICFASQTSIRDVAPYIFYIL